MKKNLNDDDLSDFKAWLNLNLNAISWEGRYLSEFNSLWDKLFLPQINLFKQFEILSGAIGVIEEGPLLTWFLWVRDKFICYLYVFHSHSISELSSFSSLALSKISFVLRNFFVVRFPLHEEYLNEALFVTSEMSPYKNKTFNDLHADIFSNEKILGSEEGDILTSLEVTLYQDWKTVDNYLFFEAKPDDLFTKTKEMRKKAFSRFLKFVQELIILFLLGGAIIFVIKVSSEWYEERLAGKISLFSPQFFWLDKNLSFSDANDFQLKKTELSLGEIEKLESLESDENFNVSSEGLRYEVESDVSLTSIDSLPKDFEVASSEQSAYEEIRKGGYRNMRYGRRKAYRLMMTSVDPVRTKLIISKLLTKFKIKQVDNVKPGKAIPGGVYFNLYVPRESTIDFLSEVSEFEETTVLESKTISSGPAGANKVFIWIKTI